MIKKGLIDMTDEIGWGTEIRKTYVKRKSTGHAEYEEVAIYKLVKITRFSKPENKGVVIFKEGD